MQELKAHALRLLDFIDQSVTEAIADPSQLKPCLVEADCALRVLQKTMLREDRAKHAQLMILDVFKINWAGKSPCPQRADRPGSQAGSARSA